MTLIIVPGFSIESSARCRSMVLRSNTLSTGCLSGYLTLRCIFPLLGALNVFYSFPALGVRSSFAPCLLTASTIMWGSMVKI